jgi:hypothetical protein
MHWIVNQYLSEITTNQKATAMHDLGSIYDKVFKLTKDATKDYLADSKNFKFYPNPPKMSDLQIVALAIASELVQIDSESALWVELERNHKKRFPNLIHRTRFNIRNKQMLDYINCCCESIASKLNKYEDTFVIDSVPIPVIRSVREQRSSIFRKESNAVKAIKGYSAIDKSYYLGYKVHLCCSTRGVVQEFAITSANVYDSKVALDVLRNQYDKVIIADKGYISGQLELDLFQETRSVLMTPTRKNQKVQFPQYARFKSTRMIIETVFSQWIDQTNFRKIYAKTFLGLWVRICSKIAAQTFKQFNNFINNRKISQTKYSFAC